MAALRFKALHLFCGLGGGALGFQRAGIETLLGVDVDKDACTDFETLTGAPSLLADLSTLQPAALLKACRGETPDVVFTSPPCKGFSGLLPKIRLEEDHYKALNRLVFQGLWLVLETWAKKPPKLIVLENVPLITQRGADLLRQVRALLEQYGYRIHTGYHDCGELGGLSQHRRRFLLVARHEAQVPGFLYRPSIFSVRPISDVLGLMPMPDDPAGGPMHRLPRLQWKTLVRLALIPAGGDWRALGTKDGSVPFNNQFRIVPWDQPSVAVTGGGTPTAGGICLADPRVERPYANGTMGVRPWDEASGAVTGNARPSAGAFTVADPRLSDAPGRHWNKFRVERWEEPARAVIGSDRVGSGAPSVQDPRLAGAPGSFGNHYRVEPWDAAAPTITGATRPVAGALSVGDPRLTIKGSRPDLLGVLRWDRPAKTVSGSASVTGGNTPSAIADPRIPEPDERPDPPPVIISIDGTWHRPLTTLELAALQGFPVVGPTGPLVLTGKSHTAWRERIGNAVPPPTARAIAGQLRRTLELAARGISFDLSSTPIWVDPQREDDAREQAWETEFEEQ